MAMRLPQFLDATGAYGRKANWDDWHQGKDFKLLNGPYFSKRDMKAMRDAGCEQIEFWDGRTSVFSINLEMEVSS